ncbi:MAG: serine/threonine-protein phosphatase [Actinobacteria bacterium]|nr:serine/threonine-protein phosphatase [Actinomycetota bacterium]
MPVLRYAARSDVGLVREGNEDSGYAGPRLLLVADGMGGHAAGELASAIAVATVANLDLDDVDQSEVLASLASSIDDVGTTISETIAVETDLTGMGTTITGMYWLGGRIAIVHVGDSRAYLLRDGELHQLTHDHTFVQTLVDSGRITEDEAAVHPRRSLLMRALDGLNPVEADLSVREARVGDRYMICTDGLSGVVRDTELTWILSTGDPTGCVTRLVDKALERGAPDNVTVVVADVVEGNIAPFGGVPVVVGAAGEPRVRQRLPRVRFPQDHQRDPDRADTTAPQPYIDSDIIVPAAEQARRDAATATATAVTRRQRRRRIVGFVVAVAIVAGLTVAGLTVARTWLDSQWYVAINGNPGTGTVAIYRGVQGTLGGFPLSQVDTDSGLAVGSMPVFDQELVSKGIPAADYADAERIVGELQARAAECGKSFPPQGCPGTLDTGETVE